MSNPRVTSPHTCLLCGGEFYPEVGQIRRGAGRYCSKRCRGIGQWANKNRRRLWACLRCGKETLAPISVAAKSRYCSLTCARPPLKTCARCGVSFQGRPQRRFCSVPCSAKGNWNTPERHAKQKRLVICQWCGVFFPQQRGTFGKFCSRDCTARATAHRSAEQGHSYANGGRRLDLGGQYFRSSWEANWARYLNCLQAQGQIKAWTYEPEVFEFPEIKRGCRFYTPDFRIVNSDDSVVFHEVKGWLDPKSVTKLRRMAKYHPAVKVLLIEKPAYDEVARKLGGLLPGWEWGKKKSRFLRTIADLKQVLT
jgi:hypothetical protein